MFKKQATYKPSTAIRNSERKSLIVEVKQHFAPTFDGQTEEQVKSITDLLLPTSGIEAASFISTKGHRGTIYTHSGLPIFIKYEDKLVPTLHTLWKCPSLVTSALTGSQVLSNLQAGSDLMVKGMFEYSSTVKKGDIVGILVSDRSHYVAVGIAAIDFESVKRDEGGKGILLVSCLGDTITPDTALPQNATAEEEVASGIDSISIDTDHTAKPPLAIADDSEWPVLSTDDIDESFVQALLYGLYVLSTDKDDMTMPMAASTLIDTHVLPYLPSHHPDLLLKKTSCKPILVVFINNLTHLGKKANKFFTKQKILKTKEVKGQLNITGIDWSAPELSSFVPHRLPESQIVSTASDVAANKRSKHDKEVLSIEVFYSLPSKFAPLSSNTNRDDYFTKQDLAEVLDQYYEKESLVSTSNKKLITIDTHLAHLLVPSNSASKKELSKDVLLRSLIKNSNEHHRVNGGKMKKGPVPDLQMVMESRQGRKSVTRILHLERFFDEQQIDQIVDELKKKCAVSVSIGEVKGTKPGSSVELTVQGKKSGEAQEVLEKWGIKKSMIKIDDKTK